jgi:non-ribosomal peptide synthase protein (TIGR01720 family)
VGEGGATAARYVPGPGGGRVYRTGDRGRWRAEGALEYGGRLDAQVKVRGQRVEPGEVEAVLRGCAGVREAAVVARRGAHGPELVGYVAAAEGLEGVEGALTWERLRAAVAAQVPEALVPRMVRVVEALPRTGSGKVDRRALAEGTLGRALASEAAGPAVAAGAEQTMAAIWAGVLGVAEVGAEDHFFQRGGDSISALQVVARARAAGLEVTLAEMFARPVLRTLVAERGRVRPARERDQGVLQGEGGLGAIQAWWLTGPGPHAHFNQSLVLRWRERVEVGALRAALEDVTTQHDGLRLRFGQGADGGWRQWYGAPDAAAVETWDVREAEDEAAAVAAAGARVQGSFDLARGPLVKGAVARLRGEDWVVLVSHHLVIDGVSWRIVLEDLATAYTARVGGRAPRWPAKTDGYLRWVGAAETTAATLGAERAYWVGVCAGAGTALPREGTDPAGTETVTLPAETTRVLLGPGHRAYGTEVNDLLLTGLALALADWHGGRGSLVALEGHGREAVIGGGRLDVSRTVGWFTSLYPVGLEVAAAPAGEDALGWQIQSVKEQLRGVPGRGVGYGLLRYVRPEGATDAALAMVPAVLFNYLGSFGAGGPAAALFQVSEASAGSEVAGAWRREPGLTVTGVVMEGTLRLSASYEGGQFARARVAWWLGAYAGHLRRIAAHCLAAAPRVTPSDLGVRGLDLAGYRALVAAHGTAPEAVEDVWPLAPMQEGLLVHGLTEPGAYFEQTGYRVEGPLEVERLQAAWEVLLARHANLGVAIWTEATGRPVQMVPRRRAVGWHTEDWRGLPAGAQAARLAAYRAADRARGFAGGQDPLLRVAVLRLGETTHEVVWSFHHLLLDGWSGGILTAELEAVYAALVAGEAPGLPAVPSYRRYLEWLAGQDRAASGAYWAA